MSQAKKADTRWEPFKLPKLKKFASTNKEVSPFENFHRWAAKQIGPVPKGKSISVSAIWLHPKDAAELSKLVKNWIKKFHCSNSKLAERTYQWHNLEIGPSVCHSRHEPGLVSIEVDHLFITQR